MRPIPSGWPAGQAQSNQQEERVSTDQIEWVNAAQTEARIEALRKCVNRGAPYGAETWNTQIAARLVRFSFPASSASRNKSKLILLKKSYSKNEQKTFRSQKLYNTRSEVG